MPDERIGLQLDLGDSTAKARELSGALDKVKDSSEQVADKGFGKMGQAGLQAGRALQDFAQGGLGGILNNIEGLVQALGGGPGMAGLLTAVGVAASVALPKIKEWFGAVKEGKEELKQAAEETKKWHAEIDKTHEAFQKLAQAANTPELESAKEIVGFLSERPNAEQAKAAVARGIGADVAQTMLGPDEQKRYAAASAKAGEKEQGMAAILARQKAAGFTDEQLETSRAQLDRAFGTSRFRAEAEGLLDQGRSRYADRLVGGATVAGPAGAAARDELLRRTQGVPGLQRLQDLTPEAVEARQEQERIAKIKRDEFNRASTARTQDQFQQSEKFREMAERTQGENARKEAAAADKRRDDTLKRQQAQKQHGIDTVRGSNLDEHALLRAQEIRQQGGAYDRFGRFHQQDATQQRRQLGREVNQAIAAQFPKMPQQARAAAGQDVMNTLMQANGQLVNNQQNFQMQLQEAKRILDAARRVGQQARQSNATSGIPG
jgi:hypothetical protein